MLKSTSLLLALLSVAFGMLAPAHAMTSEVPKSKQTVLGKYITAKEAYEKVAAERDAILFLDIRTSGEAMFVGNTAEADGLVPFVELKQPAVWDEKNKRFALVPNVSFVTLVDAALERKGLSRTDPVFLMCRSGDRSAKAVNILAGAGYTNVWSVYDGFEGDPGKDGRRTLTGWKNSGLPWSYKLDKDKVSAGFALTD